MDPAAAGGLFFFIVSIIGFVLFQWEEDKIRYAEEVRRHGTPKQREERNQRREKVNAQHAEDVRKNPIKEKAQLYRIWGLPIPGPGPVNANTKLSKEELEAWKKYLRQTDFEGVGERDALVMLSERERRQLARYVVSFQEAKLDWTENWYRENGEMRDLDNDPTLTKNEFKTYAGITIEPSLYPGFFGRDENWKIDGRAPGGYTQRYLENGRFI